MYVCVCGDWICCSYISRGTGSVNDHGGGFNDTAVNLIASHLLGGLKSLWCSLATELKHMGNYLQWAPSPGEFTDVHFPKRRGSLFFDLCRGDKIKRVLIYCRSPSGSVWYLMLSCAARFSQIHTATRTQSLIFSSRNKDVFTSLTSIWSSHTVKKSKSMRMWREDVTKRWKRR